MSIIHYRVVAHSNSKDESKKVLIAVDKKADRTLSFSTPPLSQYF